MAERVLFEVNPRPEGGWEVVRPLAARIREYRAERMARLAADEPPLPLEPGPRAVLHFIPHASFNNEVTVDIRQFASDSSPVKPLGASGNWNQRFNADGFLTSYAGGDGSARRYLQLFRNGIVETLTTTLFTADGNQVYLASLSFEQQVIAAVRQCVQLAERLQIGPPYAALLGLSGAKGVLTAADRSRFWDSTGHPIDRSEVLAPPIHIEDSGADPAAVLRPGFDFIWQAAGWPGSQYYGANGERLG